MDEGGRIYYAQTTSRPLWEQQIWRYETSFESPYYAEGTLQLWIVPGGMGSYAGYAIEPDGQGGFRVFKDNPDGANMLTDEVELLEVAPAEGGHQIKLRFNAWGGDTHGLLIGDSYHDTQAIRGDDQTFEYFLESGRSLWLNTYTWPKDQQIEVELE